MASPFCLRCLERSLSSVERPVNVSLLHRATFSTSRSLSKKSATPQKGKQVAPQQKGKRLQLKKTTRDQGRGIAPTDRKALRKRIVLSNTNALEVEGLQDLTGDKLVRHEPGIVALDKYREQMLGFKDDTVDALRALEAFKPTQAWNLFRRPATLTRAETALFAGELVDAQEEQKAIRKIVFGARGSGKSALLLQALAMARMKDFVVVHFPEANELTSARTAYQPVDTGRGTIYVQPHYTAHLLGNIARANHALLSNLRLSQTHQLSIPVQPNISLARFVELGASDPDVAWPVWQAFWSEMTTASQPQSKDGLARPPILITMDGVDHVMRLSAYLDSEVNPIHAHDLAILQHFTQLLSGKIALPNGGMVLAATSESSRPTTPTLDYHLDLKYSQAHESKEPAWDPYQVQDPRVANIMKDVQVLKLHGLSKEEARGIMEYYARSGILRNTINEGFVSEKWTLAGAGIIGELEKAAVTARFY